MGSFISRKVDRRKFLFSWILLGILTTMLLPFFHGTFFSIIFSLLLSVSLGLGLPASLSFIAESTVADERGRVSGIIILSTFAMTFGTLILAKILSLSLMETILLSAGLRSASLLAFVLDRFVEKKEVNRLRLQRGVYKNFLFYLLPWVMFNIASGLALALIPANYAEAVANGTTVRNLFLALFGLTSGFVADRYGRKQIIIVGLLILGAGFMLLGFVISPESVFVYLTTSGIAYGLFFVVFLAVPGDLSSPSSREKFYAMGTILPLTILFSLYLFPPAFLSTYPASTISQVLSLILFLSILPVLKAKETLPASIMRLRKIREHIIKVTKLAQESKKAES